MSISTNMLESNVVHMLPDGRFNVPNAAGYLGLKEKTLAMMRSKGIGPKFIKRGRVFYFKVDLDSWLNSDGRYISTAQCYHPKNAETANGGE